MIRKKSPLPNLLSQNKIVCNFFQLLPNFGQVCHFLSNLLFVQNMYLSFYFLFVLMKTDYSYLFDNYSKHIVCVYTYGVIGLING